MSSILLGFLWRRHRLSTGLALLIPIHIGLAIGLLYPTYAAQRKLLEVFKFSTAYFGQGQLDLFSAQGGQIRRLYRFGSFQHKLSSPL